MIGRKVTIKNSINLHDLGIVEDVSFSDLSYDTIYQDRASALPNFKKKKRVQKSIIVSIRVIQKSIKLVREKIEEIVGLSFDDNPINFLLDENKFCRATLENADKETAWRTGLLTLEFTNLDGLWYSVEQTSTNKIVENLGKIDSDKFTMSITPSSNKVNVKNSKGDKLELTLFNTTSTVLIDFEKKTVTQNNRHVPLSLASRFFTLQKGRNQFVIEGATSTVIKYREVVAL